MITFNLSFLNFLFIMVDMKMKKAAIFSFLKPFLKGGRVFDLFFSLVNLSDLQSKI